MNEIRINSTLQLCDSLLGCWPYRYIYRFNHSIHLLIENFSSSFFPAFHIDFADSKKNGGKLLVINGFRFFRNKKRGHLQYWKCRNYYKERCPAIAIHDESTLILRLCHQHQHMESNDIEIKPLPSSVKEQLPQLEAASPLHSPDASPVAVAPSPPAPSNPQPPQPEPRLSLRRLSPPPRSPPPLHEYKTKQCFDF